MKATDFDWGVTEEEQREMMVNNNLNSSFDNYDDETDNTYERKTKKKKKNKKKKNRHPFEESFMGEGSNKIDEDAKTEEIDMSDVDRFKFTDRDIITEMLHMSTEEAIADALDITDEQIDELNKEILEDRPVDEPIIKLLDLITVHTSMDKVIIDDGIVPTVTSFDSIHYLDFVDDEAYKKILSETDVSEEELEELLIKFFISLKHPYAVFTKDEFTDKFSSVSSIDDFDQDGIVVSAFNDKYFCYFAPTLPQGYHHFTLTDKIKFLITAVMDANDINHVFKYMNDDYINDYCKYIDNEKRKDTFEEFILHNAMEMGCLIIDKDSEMDVRDVFDIYDTDYLSKILLNIIGRITDEIEVDDDDYEDLSANIAVSIVGKDKEEVCDIINNFKYTKVEDYESIAFKYITEYSKNPDDIDKLFAAKAADAVIHLEVQAIRLEERIEELEEEYNTSTLDKESKSDLRTLIIELTRVWDEYRKEASEYKVFITSNYIALNPAMILTFEDIIQEYHDDEGISSNDMDMNKINELVEKHSNDEIVDVEDIDDAFLNTDEIQVNEGGNALKKVMKEVVSPKPNINKGDALDKIMEETLSSESDNQNAPQKTSVEPNKPIQSEQSSSKSNTTDEWTVPVKRNN